MFSRSNLNSPELDQEIHGIDGMIYCYTALKLLVNKGSVPHIRLSIAFTHRGHFQ